MAYDKGKVFPIIMENIENGMSLRKALLLPNMPNRNTFFSWIENDLDKSNQYARACEIRAELIFEEILKIADTPEHGVTVKETEKGIETTTGDMIAHRRLQVDARKWMLGKMQPKKYGDKLDLTSDGKSITSSLEVVIHKPKEDED